MGLARTRAETIHLINTPVPPPCPHGAVFSVFIPANTDELWWAHFGMRSPRGYSLEHVHAHLIWPNQTGIQEYEGASTAQHVVSVNTGSS